MMPPHGLCSQHDGRAPSAPSASTRCARSTRCRGRRSRPPTRRCVGWRPAEFVDGCAVIPRIPLSSSVADIALRAFAGPSGRDLRPPRGRRGRARAAGRRRRRPSTGSATSRWTAGRRDRARQPRRCASWERASRVRPFARRRPRRAAGRRGASSTVEAPGDAVDRARAERLVGRRRARSCRSARPSAVAGRWTIRLHGRATSPTRPRSRRAGVAAVATGAADGDRGARPRAPAGARSRALLALVDQPARAAVVGSAALTGADRGRTRTRATALRVHNLLTRSTECVTSCWARVAVRRRRARRAGV